jgi:hypothetical protein
MPHCAESVSRQRSVYWFNPSNQLITRQTNSTNTE